MAAYTNVTEQAFPVRTARGEVTVKPGEQVLTAPKNAELYLLKNWLEPVVVKAKASRKSKAQEAAD